MRAITVNFWQNLGTLVSGAQCALTGNVTKVGEQVLTVDDQLTKIAPGDLTVEVADPGDLIWSFIQNSLVSSSGLLPPYLQMLVGGSQVYLGQVDPSRIVRHLSGSTHSIELAAQDWSIELANSYLGAPTALPWKPNTLYGKGTYVINGNVTYICAIGGHSAASGGPTGALSPILDGPDSLVWAYVAPSWIRPVPTVAATGTPGSHIGWSDSYSALQYGANPSIVYFPDPCGWIYTGAILSMDRPVFNFIPRNQVGLPNTGSEKFGPVQGQTYLDIDGQRWLASVTSQSEHAAFLWVQQTWWSTPIGCPSCALPAPWFPPKMILSGAGSSWQVSVDGKSWVAVYDTTGPFTALKVLPTPADQTLIGYTPYCKAQLSANPWPPEPPGANSQVASLWGSWSANFTLANPAAADMNYWTVTVAVPANPATPCHVLNLNSVNGPVMGDVLEIVDSDASQSFTVASVDPVLSQINTLEAITNVPLGAHVYWDANSQAEMVMEDPRTILIRAAQPFSVDLTRFTAPTTADPMLGLLPLRPTIGADLFAVGDIETTLTGIKLSTGGTWVNPANGAPLNSYSWTGNPDAGWAGPTASAPAVPMSDWTCQLQAAPASLMPYESGSLASTNYFQRLRNRAYGDATYRQENNGLIYVVIGGTGYLVNGAYVQTTVNSAGQPVYQYTQNGTVYTTASANFTPWTPAGACLANGFFCYDYTAMRRITFTGSVLSVRTWSGTWSGPTAYNWPGGSYVQSAVPMIGAPGALIAYVVTPSGQTPTADRLELWGLSGGLLNTGTATVPSALIGGTLVTTPWAVYLVGASAVALVTVVAGVITFSTLSMVDQIDILFPNSLTARTAGEIVIFGRVDSGLGVQNTETWMFRINATPQASLDKSIIWSEKVCDGAPSLIGAVRDPSKAGRIVGHMGGTIFQVDSARPYCVERWTPGGLTALEAIEHVCQLYGALAVPDAFGMLHIISRVNNDAPISLTVKQKKIDSALNWGSFSSIVRVTSQDGKYYFDAYGQQGGALMEITNQPMVWSLSGCAGMAESMVSWFGVVRPLDTQEWTWPDATTAPPWEGLPPFARITLNQPTVISYPFFTGDGLTMTAPLMGPWGGPVYGPVVFSVWSNDWQGNLQLSSTSRTNLFPYSNFAGNTGAGLFPTGWGVTGSTSNFITLNPNDGTFFGNQFISMRAADSAGWHGLQCTLAGMVVGQPYGFAIGVRVPTGVTATDLTMYLPGNTPSTITVASADTLNAQPKDKWVRYTVTATWGTVITPVSFMMLASTPGAGYDLACPHMELGSTVGVWIPSNGAPRTLTDYALVGTGLALAQAPAPKATLTWSGTYQTGPWRVMELGQDYVAGTAKVSLVGAP